MDRGAEVMMEAGERKLHGACSPADGGLRLEDLDVKACFGEDDRRGQAVGASSDHAGFARVLCAGWLRHCAPIPAEIARGRLVLARLVQIAAPAYYPLASVGPQIVCNLRMGHWIRSDAFTSISSIRSMARRIA